MKTILLALGMAFFIFSPGHAQYKITNFTDMNQINSLVEDGDYIWVCTSGGAFKRRKSDGSIVTVFNQTNSGIARNRVQSMYIDFYGNYWFGTNWGGISKFNGSTWTTIDQVDGFRITECKTITEDINGNLWFGINDGHVLKYDGETWENIDLQGNWYVGAILSDDDGNIWFGIPGINGMCYKMDQEGTISEIPGPGNAFAENGVYDIGKDRVGNIWFTTYTGVYRYKPLTGSWTDFGSSAGYNDYAYSQDSDGNIWIASGSGIYKYDGMTWAHYTSGESGDRADMAMDVLCDAQDHVWVGGYNGLARIEQGSTTWSRPIRINALKSNYVETMSFTSDGTAKLFGQFSYMIGYTDNYWWETTPASSCYIGWIKNSVVDKYDNTWITYLNGGDSIVKLIRITPNNTATCYNASGKIDFGQYASGFVNDIAYDQKYNILWLATDQGLIWFNASWASYGRWTTGMYGVPDNNITGVTVKDGTAWYSTATKGIGWYDAGSNTYGVLNPSNGLPSNNINDIIFDKNGDMVFIGGSALYRQSGNSYIPFYLPAYYDVLAVDSINNIWLGGYSGAAKFNGDALQTFTTDDGLNENNVYDIVVAPNNDVWLCSGYFGITRITTEDPQPDFSTPITCLPSVTRLENNSTKTDTLSRFEWDINDDGSVDFTSKNFIHQFTEPGDYTIGLTAWNDEKHVHITKKIKVVESPEVSISPTGLKNICFGDQAEIRAEVTNLNPDLTYSYLWNTGITGKRMVTDTSGIFYFDASNGTCSTRSDSVTIMANTPFDGSRICMVTVDAEEGKNMVIWDPAHDQGIVSWNIYKLFGNSYVPIGNVPAGDPSFFVDYNSTPEAEAARYAISALDTCGNESAKSPFHQTIHLGASIGAKENTIVLDWTPYIDESGSWEPEWYYIYRGMSADNMVLHDSISATFTEWNDLDPGDNRYYQISAKKAGLCYISTKKASGGPFGYSLSNLEDNKLKSGTGIEDISGGSMEIYPNPFSTETRITWSNPENMVCRVIISGLQGQIVREADGLTGDLYILEKGNMKPGMYFVTVVSGDNIFKSRMVVQ